MSITDELREWIRARNMMAKETFDQLTAIADRIDAEHEKEMRMAWKCGFYHIGMMDEYADLEARVERIERLLNHKGAE